MMMERISLDGEWAFLPDEDERFSFKEALETDGWTNIQVPAPWQTQGFPELQGCGWYARKLTLPEDWEEGSVLICFGAVDYAGTLWINGEKIAHFSGGYIPYRFRADKYLRWDEENEIILRVEDGCEHYPFSQIPHGKQSWYGNISGIWQSVYIERRGRAYIEECFVRVLDERHIQLQGKIAGGKEGQVLEAELQPREGWPVRGKADIVGDEFVLTIEMGHIKWWSLDDPHLYKVILRLFEDGKLIDVWEDKIGVRGFCIKDGKFYLNGYPVYLMGALDQDFYSHTRYTTPSREYLLEQFRKARNAGFNLLRCHIKIPDPVYLEVADEVGLLVWYELPSWQEFTELTKQEAEKILHASLRRDANRACLVGVSLVNEGWGVDFYKEDARSWFKSLYRRAKEEFGGFVVDNSPCMVGHVVTDVEDYHKYYGMPQHAEEFKRWLDEFCQEPNWLYLDCKETEKGDAKPRMLSEFGMWGLPALQHLKASYKGMPPFFKTQAPPLRPEGVEERFAQSTLGEIYDGDFDKFACATQIVQGEGLKFMIEQVRRREKLSGYVLTELTDIDWEANGVFSFTRDKKYAGAILSFCQGQDLLLLALEKNVFCTGERVEGELYFSHFSRCDYEGGIVRWWIDGTDLGGEFRIENTPQGSVRRIGKITFIVPEDCEARWVCLRLALNWWDEERVSNFYRLLFVPEDLIKRMPAVYFGNIGDEEKGKLEESGIRVAAPDEAELAVCLKRLDEGAKEILRRGGVCIVCQPEWVESAELDGDWCSAFFWAHPQLFQPIPVGGVLSFEAKSLITNRVLKCEGEVLAGAFRGWMYEEGGCLVRIEERVYLTTFALIDALKKGEPLAKVLLVNLTRA